ncbi:MAG TPA: ribonuclease P protein component [Acidimicrobiales bacterium]|nr:ribonuclease P protein component [Acidimicrobiales bacterium]
MLWRIRDRTTFEALRRSGKRARRGSVTVTYLLDAEAPVPRVAYAVGKRVGNAVVRNRLRRRLRAAAGEAQGPDRALAPGAYLISVGPAAGSLTYEELKREVAAAMTAACGTPTP